MTEEASGLRHAEDVRTVEGAGARVAVRGAARSEPRGGVAHREETEADERRVLGAIDELVDPAGLEAALEAQVGGVREPPRAAVDRDRGRVVRLAHGQPRGRVVE